MRDSLPRPPRRPPVKLLDGPSQWSWEDGVATFFMPRDGDTLPGGDGVIEIKYEFPDGGAAIWHHNVAPALDILAAQGCEDATLNVLRQVVNRRNQQSRHNTH